MAHTTAVSPTRFSATASSAKNTRDIGPGALDSGTGTFVLNVPGWLAVQCYVTAGMHLPTDATSMRAQLPAAPPNGMDQFSDLIKAYANIHAHCQFWNDHTLQDAVSCAADIVHYNQKVPSYYGALTALLPELELAPPNPGAVTQFTAILQNLIKQAQAYADHAKAVKDGMTTFADQTAQDQLTLQPLLKKYTDQLGKQSPMIQKLSNDLATDRQTMSAAQDEYQHDVIVAATSATYAWVWPVGTIAAGIVAGIYGKKATDALARVNGMKAAIATISDELQAAATLLLDLTSIQGQLSDIGAKLAAALPVLQTMQGAWTSIASDMQNILTIINEDIGQAPALIMSLGIDEAIAAWKAVAKEADIYRNTAFISIPDTGAGDAADLATVKAAGLALQGAMMRLSRRGEMATGRVANYA